MLLTDAEKGAFLKLFNRGGYVLDFDNDGFNAFTKKHVGVALTEKYRKSKGKSLEDFCYSSSDEDATKLLLAFFEHYELNCRDKPEEERFSTEYKRCKTILEKKSSVFLEMPAMNATADEHVKEMRRRAFESYKNGDFESTVTKSRTLLEYVFRYAITQRGETPIDNGEIQQLYKQVRKLYNMHVDDKTDKRVKKLLSGLNTILDAIAELRNKNSDSHVTLSKGVIKSHHALLCLNSAITMAEFILSVEQNCSKKNPSGD